MSFYQQVRRDYEYLYSLAEVDDLVEIDAMVFELMENPTKAKAADMYLSAMEHWFWEHKGEFQTSEVNRIAEAYGYENGAEDEPT